MMKFAASLTVTGILGFLILEALKIVLAPVAGWLIGILAVAIKVILGVFFVGAGLLFLGLVIGLSIWVYRRYRKSQEIIPD